MLNEELMFSDYINLNGVPCSVIDNMVSRDELLVEDIDKHAAVACNVNEISPIPLTVAILENNGFSRYKDAMVNEEWGFRVIIGKDDGLIVFLNSNFTHIHYVHELQNVLRVTGKPLCAKYFKPYSNNDCIR